MAKVTRSVSFDAETVIRIGRIIKRDPTRWRSLSAFIEDAVVSKFKEFEEEKEVNL